MTKTIKINKSKQYLSSIISITIIFFILAIIIIITGIVENENNKIYNQIDVSGVVSEVSYNDDDDYYQINLINDERNYTVSKSLAEIDDINDLVKVNDEIVLTISSNKMNNKRVPIIGLVNITKENHKLLDLQRAYYDSNLSAFIFAFALIGLCLIGVFVYLHIKKKESFIEYEMKDFVMRLNHPFNMNEYSNTKKNNKKFIITLIFYLLFLVLIIIGIAIVGSIIGDDNVLLILLTIFSAIVLLFLDAWMLFIFSPAFYKKKKIDGFVIDYLNSLKVNDEDKVNKGQYGFLDEGIRVEDYDDEVDDEIEFIAKYEDLNLYACCKYTNTFNYASIFICSDLDQDKYSSDIVYCLNKELLILIKEKNLKVDGLEYLLTNFKNEVIKNNSKHLKKEIIINYKNK